MSAETKAATLYSPLPDRASALRIADQLLEEQLIACCNILGPVTSVFTYEGAHQTGEEVGCLFKTSAAKLEEAGARLEALHPYDTPAIIGSICDYASAGTLDWLAEQTGG